MTPDAASEELARRADAIEGGYEMMLAYAAQGLARPGRRELRPAPRSSPAVRYGADRTGGVLSRGGGGARRRPERRARRLSEALDADAAFTQSALRLVLAQPGISSQMIDNLNASIHVRALLTDVFVIDEIIKS